MNFTPEDNAIAILSNGLSVRRETSYPPSPPRTITPERTATIADKLAPSTQKFDLLENGVKVLRYCGDCKATKTSGHWCQDPFVHNGHICQKCYRRRKRSVSNPKTQYVPPSRHCESCRSDNTKRIWFKHPTEYQKYVCESCFLQEKRDTLTNPEEKSCSCCLTGESHRWYTDTKHPGMFLCRKCYRKQNLTILDIKPNGSRKRRACGHCSAKETSHWYFSTTINAHLCRNCFSKSNGLQRPLEKRFCNSCRVSHTSQWHTDHHSSDGYICRKCYVVRRSGSDATSSVRSSPLPNVANKSKQLPGIAYFSNMLGSKTSILPMGNQSLPPIHSYLARFQIN
jgi:hypothetical protein